MLALTMKAVLQRTGLTPHTLRAWEKRYGAVSPERSNTKRRLYSEADALKLGLLAELVRRGHSIGKIAKLTTADLRKHLQKSQGASTGLKAANPVTHSELEHLLSQIEAFDLAGARSTIGRVRYVTSPRDFAFEFVPKLMLSLGKLFHQKRISIAEEHALSEAIYSHLRQIYDDLESQEAGRPMSGSFLFCTREGDPHDMGLLMAAIACRYNGNTTYYVGRNLPLESLLESATKVKPRAIVMGLSLLPSKDEKISPRSFLRSLDQELPQGIELWIGGSATESISKEKYSRGFWIFKNIAELEAKLEASPRSVTRKNQ